MLAGRVGLGSILGGPEDVSRIPANYRFFAGGVGSIRGYRAQSVGPSGPFGFTVGGRSEFDASIEARIKVTDTIGIAPFLDVGGAYRERDPAAGYHVLPGTKAGTRARLRAWAFSTTRASAPSASISLLRLIQGAVTSRSPSTSASDSPSDGVFNRNDFRHSLPLLSRSWALLSWHQPDPPPTRKRGCSPA